VSRRRPVLELLGYPEDSRLLIVNADDFGSCHANNAAILEAITGGIVTSTTLMTPCPWAPEALRMLRSHPEIAFGVHLTLISEFDGYRWGSLSPRDQVPSLLDDDGYFCGLAVSDELLSSRAAAMTSWSSRSVSPESTEWRCGCTAQRHPTS
jgi:hypothetical protein